MEQENKRMKEVNEKDRKWVDMDDEKDNDAYED